MYDFVSSMRIQAMQFSREYPCITKSRTIIFSVHQPNPNHSMKAKIRSFRSIFPGLFVALVNSANLQAAIINWDGNGANDANGNWSTGSNWSTDTAPGNADTAILTDVSTGTRTIAFDTSAVSPVQQIEFNQTTASSINILDIQKNLTVTSSITLGSDTGIERINIGSAAIANIVFSPNGGITLNPGGELVMTATGSGASSYIFGNIGGSGTTTIQGGTLTVAPTNVVTGTSASNTHAGGLTMTSGSLIIDNITGQQDRRILIQGAVNITGGSVSSTKSVATGNITYSSGSPIVFQPDFFSTNLNMSLDRTGDQSLSTNRTLGVFLLRGTGVKTITSTTIGNGIGQIQMFDNNNTVGSQTTLKLGSNLTSNTGASMPLSQNFGNTHESGRIDLGIDTNGFILDLSAGAGAGTWTPNASTQSGVTNTVWNLSGSGAIKANRFVLSSSAVTTNLDAATTLHAVGGNSTANDLGGTGILNSGSLFRYSGSAVIATPATLTSNRPIGKLEVTSGHLRISGNLNAGGSITVSGGTLLVPATASLYGGTSANWTAANLNILSGGTLALNVGGTGEFSTTDITTILTNLTTSSDNGLRAGATLAFDTTNATGGIFTIANSLTDTTGTTGGSLNIHKLGGTTTLALTGANSYSGLTTVSAGILRVSHDTALGSTNAGTILNGSINSTLGTLLDLNGVSVDSGESLTLASGNITGDSRVTLRTVGTTVNTWAGPILLTGSKTVQFNANPGGQLNLTGAIRHLDYTGPVSLRGGGTGTISGGIYLSNSTNITFNEATSVWNINTSGNTWGNTNLFRGTLVMGADQALPITTSLNFGGTDGSGTLKLNGKNQTVAGLTTNVTTTTNKIVNGNATPGLLTIDTSGNNTYHGVLGGTDTNDNNFSIVKNGAGTLSFSAIHTYSGNTSVLGGTLRFNQPNPNNDSSTIAIAASGATLELNFDESAGAVSDTVDKLFIGGVQQNAGVYKAIDNVSDNGTGISQITGPGTITVTSGPGGFSSWQAANGGAATTGGINDDHDNDGVSNGIEHFLVGSNSSTGPTTLPSVINQSGTLSITWTKASTYQGSLGTEFFVESSETLNGTWTNEASPGNVSVTGNQVTYTFPNPLGSKKFVRLRVLAP